jgi:hypothetical protein
VHANKHEASIHLRKRLENNAYQQERKVSIREVEVDEQAGGDEAEPEPDGLALALEGVLHQPERTDATTAATTTATIQTHPQHPSVSSVAARAEAEAAAEKSHAETALDCCAESSGEVQGSLLLGAVEGAGVHGAVPAAASALRVPRMRSRTASNFVAGAARKFAPGYRRHEAPQATCEKTTAAKTVRKSCERETNKS